MTLTTMYYKYLHQDRLCVIRDLKIRFTQPGALNDPFESVPLIVDRDDPYYKKLPDLATRTGRDIIETLSFTVGILSLSRTKESLLLWSHYANSHKGYVIEFDEESDFFNHHEQGLERPLIVSYTSQRPKVNINDISIPSSMFEFHPDTLKKALGHKPIEWAYEEEVRIFRNIVDMPSIRTSDDDPYEIKLADIPPNAISGIYCGANMDINTQKKIVVICKRNNLRIPVYKASLSNTSYSLDFSVLESP